MNKILVLAIILMLSFGAVAEQQNKVTVYGHTGCPWTNKTLQYLDKNNVSYTLLDVKNDDNANRDFYARGFKKIPQVLIGDEVISGWRKGKLKALLKENALLSP